MKNLSYAHGISDIPLKGETIGNNLRTTIEKYGECEALVVVSQGYRATYQELWIQVEEVAKGLLAYGIKKGDRVGIWAPNRFEWVLVQFATARIGAIMVNINPAYKGAALKYTNSVFLGVIKTFANKKSVVKYVVMRKCGSFWGSCCTRSILDIDRIVELQFTLTFRQNFIGNLFSGKNHFLPIFLDDHSSFRKFTFRTNTV